VLGDEITHFFGDITPLVDASFQLAAGDCVALSGPNGAGKSTLLRILATLLKPAEGSLTVDDRFDAFEFRRSFRPRIGWVGHEPMLYPDLTGRENLQLWSRLHQEHADSVDAWLARVGVDHAADRAVRTWSRGMKQRLAIARSLVHEPTLVLWDEPTNGLDREGITMLSHLADEIVASERICVLISHQPESVPGATNRSWELQNGEIFER
jgi:heme exporter protein A